MCTLSVYAITAEVFPLAVAAVKSTPYAVEVVGSGIDESGLVGEDTGLEIAVALPFHADAGTCEVGGADIGHGAIENHDLEVHPRAELPLEARPEAGVAVEVLAEVVAGLLGMQQADVDAATQQSVEDGKEGFHITVLAATDIEVFQVGGADPQVVTHGGTSLQHFRIVFFVGNIFNHFRLQRYTLFSVCAIILGSIRCKGMEEKNIIEIKNKRAAYEYFLMDEYTAGIVLMGSEIKSIREGKANLNDAWCTFVGNELFVRDMHISEYKFGSYWGHQAKRDRKLLLNRRELRKLQTRIKERGYTIVPELLFINPQGRAKLTIALAKGKHHYDKRETLKAKDSRRDMERELA